MSEDFSIGKFKLQNAEPSLGNSKPFCHCFHPLSTTHALLCSRMSTGVQEIQLVPFDLRLVSIAGRQLSLLASKVNELHSLHRYICQVQEQLSSEVRTSQDLPSRFMRNINETLLEKSDCTWVTAAYHLAATGHCYPEVKDWLVDELGERVFFPMDYACVARALTSSLGSQALGQSNQWRLRKHSPFDSRELTSCSRPAQRPHQSSSRSSQVPLVGFFSWSIYKRIRQHAG